MLMILNYHFGVLHIINKDDFLQNAEFDWSETLQGHILSAFYYGYVLAQIPGGILAQRYGGKHVFGVGIFLTSVLTLLTPIAARMGPAYLIGVRVLEGIGEVSILSTKNTVQSFS